MTRIVLDDLCFQFGEGGVARLWRTFVRTVASGSVGLGDAELIVLNRTDQLSGLGLVEAEFPEYDFRFPAEDRRLLSSAIRDLQADVFVSTYFTTVYTAPSLVLLLDSMPEEFGFAESNRGWLERRLAILNADGFAAISKSTREDFLKHNPFAANFEIPVVYPAVDSSTFRRRTSDEVEAFRRSWGFPQDYVVMVGSRYQTGGYKNGKLLFDALLHEQTPRVDLLLVGGEAITAEEEAAAAQAGVRLSRHELDDAELAAALTGARALVYPSLYEGFGIPILEALACGTPVVCCSSSSMTEVAGDLALYISGRDSLELSRALEVAGAPSVRSHFLEAGPAWTRRFEWRVLTERLLAQILAVARTEESVGAKHRRGLLRAHDRLVRGMQC